MRSLLGFKVRSLLSAGSAAGPDDGCMWRGAATRLGESCRPVTLPPAQGSASVIEIPQACAVCSPSAGVLSVIEIFRQLRGDELKSLLCLAALLHLRSFEWAVPHYLSGRCKALASGR